jgi:UDP-N-acetylmuramate dehydrogenase
MILKKNEKLAPYTSFKIGGRTPLMFIPESQKDMLDLLKRFRETGEKYYVLGNGSNILINDKGIDRVVVNNKQSCDFINFQKNGIVEVGSSFDMREFIRLCVDEKLKVFTDLITIPASIGGAVYMNAGRGGNKVCVSDFLLSVKFFDGERIRELKKDDCLFSYRYSIFHQHQDWLILSAKFQFDYQAREAGAKKMLERINLVKERSYFKHHSAGSIFKKRNHLIMKIVKGLKIGNAGYSKFDENVILNFGSATFKDVSRLINLVKFLHFIFFKKCKLEIKIWG